MFQMRLQRLLKINIQPYFCRIFFLSLSDTGSECHARESGHLRDDEFGFLHLFKFHIVTSMQI